MPTPKRPSLTPPDRANELFAKLLDDPSAGTLETRETLFSELKQELELLASLQEQHLYPVLEGHEEAEDLVREALESNRQTKALLDEIENAPKDGADFVSKLAELRRNFQQHIRSDKEELLPVALTVLSNEEVEVVMEKAEAEIAEVEATKRKVQPRRRTTGRARPQASGTESAGESLLAAIAAEDEAGEFSGAVPEALQDRPRAAPEMPEHAIARGGESSIRSGPDAPGLMDHASQAVRALVRANAILAQGTRELSLAWFDMRCDRWLKNLDGLNELVRCRTFPDAVAAQSALIRQNHEQMIENSRRLRQLAAEVTREVSQTITAPRAETTAEHADCAA